MPRVNLKVNCQLWLIMVIDVVSSTGKFTMNPQVGDADTQEAVHVEAESTLEISSIFLPICCRQRLLKNKSKFKKKNQH